MGCLNPLVRIVDPDGEVHIRSSFGFDPMAQNTINPKWMYIPCGKCDGCRAHRSKEWSDRMMLEASLHDHNWFVTLTFNDKFLEEQKGESGVPSLRVDVVQRFMKRLRREYGKPLRFYCAGEYGSLEKSFRPHYHLILFGLYLPPDDLIFLRKNNLNQDYFSSKLIAKVWSDPVTKESYGFNVVGKVDQASCRYTARYVQKKLNGQDKLIYEKLGVKEPFSVMSRNPGLGAGYLDEHPDWFRQNFIPLSTDTGSLTVVAPKYFEKKLELLDPELAEKRKFFRRSLAQMSDDLEQSQTDKDKWSYAKTVEANLKKSLEVLTSFETL